MRLGIIKIESSYVVDLDNERMVDQAKECIIDDLTSASNQQQLGMWLEELEDDNKTLDEDLIPSFLLDEENED